MKLLIIEDEPKTGNYLRQGLIEAGYVVDLACNGVDGLHLAGTGEYQLVILDVMLPGLDGWNVLSRLRADGWPLPVLFLTARSSIADRVQGLELGADDYLAKPFAFAELLARVRTLLRRGQALPQAERIVIADLVVDTLRRRVERAGQRIALSQKEYTLLELLARRQGEVLPRSLIASQVWDMNFDSDTNVIDVAIRRLRAKIDDGFDAKLIVTVRGMAMYWKRRRTALRATDEPAPFHGGAVDGAVRHRGHGGAGGAGHGDLCQRPSRSGRAGFQRTGEQGRADQ